MATQTLPETCSCDTHPEGAHFYVTARDDRGRYTRLSGPYDTHGDALERVRDITNWAMKVDPRAPWYSYGTAAIDGTALGAYERLSPQLT